MTYLTEINELERLLDKFVQFGRVEKLADVKIETPGKSTGTLPLWSLQLGPNDPTLPVFFLVGGVHGLERVGSHVVMNYLSPLADQCRWDENLQELFRHVRLVTIPILNPGGMALNRRSNPRGVDIMRNAPETAISEPAEGQWLVSGHRYSPRLPWYRGESGEPPEVETQALIDFAKKEVLPSRFALALDVHSGFGMHDRLWYPYASSKKSFPNQAVVDRFGQLLGTAHPHHFYRIEPQTSSYVIHGDPWDYLYESGRHERDKEKKVFIPWALEMGSWAWLRKNPRQLFFRAGIFNPILPHRYSRIMRRHRNLLDFFLRAVANHRNWQHAMVNSARA
jgi:hypothetical protein